MYLYKLVLTDPAWRGKPRTYTVQVARAYSVMRFPESFQLPTTGLDGAETIPGRTVWRRADQPLPQVLVNSYGPTVFLGLLFAFLHLTTW